MPNGGAGDIHDNLLRKGEDASSRTFVNYGGEGKYHEDASLRVAHNILRSDRHGAVALNNRLPIDAQFTDNTLVRLGRLVEGQATLRNNSNSQSVPRDCARNPRRRRPRSRLPSSVEARRRGARTDQRSPAPPLWPPRQRSCIARLGSRAGAAGRAARDRGRRCGWRRAMDVLGRRARLSASARQHCVLGGGRRPFACVHRRRPLGLLPCSARR